MINSGLILFFILKGKISVYILNNYIITEEYNLKLPSTASRRFIINIELQL